MKPLFLFASLFVALQLNAQVFAPDGAVWRYVWEPIPTKKGYQQIKVIGDKFINNKLCRILQATNIGYDYYYQTPYEEDAYRLYIYTEDSVVYYWNPNDSLFYKLYDFTANVGDTFYTKRLSSLCYEQYKSKIDSITEIEVNGKQLRKFHLTVYGNDYSYQTYYIEKIGYYGYLIPILGPGCEELTGNNSPGPITCYFDREIGVYSSGIADDCPDFTNINEQENAKTDILIYPNPTNRFINISAINAFIQKVCSFWQNNVAAFGVMKRMRYTAVYLYR